MTKNDFKERMISNMMNGFLCGVVGAKSVIQTKDMFSSNIFEEARKDSSIEFEEMAIQKLEAELEKLKQKTGE